MLYIYMHKYISQMHCDILILDTLMDFSNEIVLNAVTQILVLCHKRYA